MIKEDTKEIIMCMYSFSGEEKIKDYLSEAKGLLEKYACAKDMQTKIVKFNLE